MRVGMRWLLGWAVLVGCHGGAPGPLAPPPPTYADAAGVDVEPLAVDWAPGQRADLEVAMKEGVVVVRHDRDGLRLLKDCRVPGSYGYLPINTKEQLIRLENAQEAAVNLPLGGAGLAASIGADLGVGTALDVALVMVGKQSTPRTSLPDGLGSKPGCQGATHFVRAVTVGAFVMTTSARSQASTVASLFGGGGRYRAKGSKAVYTSDGSLEACKALHGAATAPTAQCSAVLRLDLKAIETREGSRCPAGNVRAESGKCAAPGRVASYECKPENEAECNAQCEAGNEASCYHAASLALRPGDGHDYARALTLASRGCSGGDERACKLEAKVYHYGLGVTRDAERAARLYEQACGGGDAEGCFGLGVLHDMGPNPSLDPVRAVKSYERACQGGVGKACNNLARFHQFGLGGLPRDVSAAQQLYERSCTNGEGFSCGNLAALYWEGTGVPRDQARAIELYQRACSQGAPMPCVMLGGLSARGEGLPRDSALALTYYQKAVQTLTSLCQQSQGNRCLELARLHLQGEGVPRDEAQAMSWLRKGCEALEGDACNEVGLSYDKGRGVERDPSRASEHFRRACELGNGHGCRNLALYLSSGTANAVDRSQAKALNEKACAMGLGLACLDLGRLLESESDFTRSQQLYERGCELGDGDACVQSGRVNHEGKALGFFTRGCKLGSQHACTQQALRLLREGRTRDEEALKLLRGACEANEGMACESLDLENRSGRLSVPYRELRDSLQKSCDAGNMSTCVRLGVVLLMPTVVQDKLKAHELYRRACDKGNLEGCTRLGELYEQGIAVAKEPSQAFAIYQRACTGGSPLACTHLGWLFESGTGTSKDVAQARTLYERGCNAGDGWGCTNLGELYERGISGVPADPRRALSLYSQACLRHHAGGCFHEGVLLEKGKGTAVNAPDAFARYDQSCRAGDLRACKGAISLLGRGGPGLPRSPDRARIYKGFACRLGDKPSCAGMTFEVGVMDIDAP